MDLDPFKPKFLMEIDGQSQSKDITQEITSFAFEDNEEVLDLQDLPPAPHSGNVSGDPITRNLPAQYVRQCVHRI